MDFNIGVTIILGAVAVAAIVSIVSSRNRNASKRGTRPLTSAGPKPSIKRTMIRTSKTKVRPTARRMRSGGTAYMLRRDNFATDLLFLVALDSALDYDETYYADSDYMDSTFMNDEFNYSGSGFEEYAEVEELVLDEPVYEAPEAETFEDLSSDDDTRYSGDWGGNDDSGSFDSGDDDW